MSNHILLLSSYIHSCDIFYFIWFNKRWFCNYNNTYCIILSISDYQLNIKKRATNTTRKIADRQPLCCVYSFWWVVTQQFTANPPKFTNKMIAIWEVVVLCFFLNLRNKINALFCADTCFLVFFPKKTGRQFYEGAVEILLRNPFKHDSNNIYASSNSLIGRGPTVSTCTAYTCNNSILPPGEGAVNCTLITLKVLARGVVLSTV